MTPVAQTDAECHVYGTLELAADSERRAFLPTSTAVGQTEVTSSGAPNPSSRHRLGRLVQLGTSQSV